MGAGQSVNQIEQLKTYAAVQNLDEIEVDELYNHLLSEYNLKLREIRVKRMEDVLTRRLTIVETGIEKDSESSTKEDQSETPNIPQRLLTKLLTEEQLKRANNESSTQMPQSQVHEKALKLLGDAELSAISREILPHNAKVNAKVLKRLGEEKILPERLQKRLGAPMTIEQLKAQKKVEKKEEELAQVKKDQQRIHQEKAQESVLGTS